MANYNFKAIQKVVNELGLVAQIIPNENNPLNCAKVIIKNQVFKTTQWTGIQAYQILSNFKEYGNCNTTSCNEARESGSDMISNIIPMKNKTFNEVLIEYIRYIREDEKNTFNNWTNQLYNFYNLDEQDNVINENFNISDVIEKIYETGNVINYNGYVLNNKGIEYLIRAWHKENNNKIDSEKEEMLSKRVLNKLKNMTTV